MEEAHYFWHRVDTDLHDKRLVYFEYYYHELKKIIVFETIYEYKESD